MNRRLLVIALCVVAGFCLPLLAADKPGRGVTVELDFSEVPELRMWGEKAQLLVAEWYPRITNLLPSKGFAPPNSVQLVLHKAEKGIAGTVGNKIQVHSNWIEKRPDDFGLVIHEVVHVIQAYPPHKEGWLTEGIADYIRWGIFEGQPLAKFPISQEPQGYRQGYQVTAGFLLWLESEKSPGIVSKLNAALRQGAFDIKLFERETQETLDALWTDYRESRRKP